MFKVGIIGLGNISVGYDLELSPTKFVQTHARAFQQHKGFRLTFGVDTDKAKRMRFDEFYGVPTYNSLDWAARIHKPDVIVIATPPHTHMALISRVLNLCSPRAILVEKPFPTSYAASKQIVAECYARGIAIYLNYIRRSDPAVMKVKRQILSNDLGIPFGGFGWYSRGFFNSATHFIDLLSYWFGDPVEISFMGDAHTTASNEDFEDPFTIAFRSGRVFFQPVNSDRIFHNSIELFFKNGRLNYCEENKIIWSGLDNVRLPNGRCRLSKKHHQMNDDMLRYQLNVAAELYKALTNSPYSLSTPQDTLAWNKLLDEQLTQKG